MPVCWPKVTTRSSRSGWLLLGSAPLRSSHPCDITTLSKLPEQERDVESKQGDAHEIAGGIVGLHQRETEQIVRDCGAIGVDRLKLAQKLIEQCQQGRHDRRSGRRWRRHESRSYGECEALGSIAAHTVLRGYREVVNTLRACGGSTHKGGRAVAVVLEDAAAR